MYRLIKFLLLIIIFITYFCFPCYSNNVEGIYWESENGNLHNSVFVSLKILKNTNNTSFGYYLFDENLKVIEKRKLYEGKKLIYYDQYFVGLWAQIDNQIYYSMHEGFEKFKVKDDNNVLLFVNSNDNNKVVIAIYSFDEGSKPKYPYSGLWLIMVVGFIAILSFEFKKNFKNSSKNT